MFLKSCRRRRGEMEGLGYGEGWMCGCRLKGFDSVIISSF